MGSTKIGSKKILYFFEKKLSELKPPWAPTSKAINFSDFKSVRIISEKSYF